MVCMKDTLIIPVLAGTLLAFTLALAAIGASDAAQPFPEVAEARPTDQAEALPLISVLADAAGSEGAQVTPLR